MRLITPAVRNALWPVLTIVSTGFLAKVVNKLKGAGWSSRHIGLFQVYVPQVVYGID